MQDSTNVNLVNRLVKKSFGKRFVGDGEPNGWLGGSSLKRTGFPNEISKINLFGRRYIVAGRFLKDDGSALRIRPKYLSKAQEYAQLYEKEVGKEVSITLTPPQ